MGPILVCAAVAGVLATTVGHIRAADQVVAQKPATAAAAFVVKTCSIPAARVGFLVARNDATVFAANLLKAKPAARGDICVTVYDSMVSDAPAKIKNQQHTAALQAVAKSLGISESSIPNVFPMVPSTSVSPAFNPMPGPSL